MEDQLMNWLSYLASTNGGTVPAFVDYLSVLVGAITGAMFACSRKLDIVGVCALGLIAAYGGGVIRDLLLQDHGVYFMQHPYVAVTCVIVCTAVFLFRHTLARAKRAIDLLDIISVGLFAAAGASKSLACDCGWVMAFLLGCITAVGGGALRNVFVGEVPTVFQPGSFYAIAAMGGSAAYLTLCQVNELFALLACLAATVLLRYGSLHLNLKTTTDARVFTAPKNGDGPSH